MTDMFQLGPGLYRHGGRPDWRCAVLIARDVEEVGDGVGSCPSCIMILDTSTWKQRTLQPLRPRVVTHLLGTFRYLCLRSGHRLTGGGSRIRTFGPRERTTLSETAALRRRGASHSAPGNFVGLELSKLM